MSLIDRVAIVTGAGSGIGRAIAKAYAAEGADVVLAGRRPDPLEETATAVRALGPRAVVVPSDVTVEEDVRGVVATAIDELGRVDLLVNAAASAAEETSTANVTVESWNETLAATLTSVMLVSRECLTRSMLARRAGAIVNVASTAGLRGVADKAAFSAAKAGVLRFTEALAGEVGPHGIRVNAIVPGLVATERLQGYYERVSAQRGIDYDRVIDEATRQVALRRLIRPEEIAAVAVFLASEQASAITGQALEVSGG